MNPARARRLPSLEPRLSEPGHDLYVPPRRQPPPRAPRPGVPLIGALIWLLLGSAALPVVLILALRWLPPPTTAFMLQSPVTPVRHEWVPATRIAKSMRHAVVASEDQKFFEHRGFDFEAIEQALSDQRDGGRRRGASTISQQTAKNLFLWPGGGYARKGIEAVLTVLIETLWPKDRILEVYLNIAEFGPGIYGVEAAARSHFGKSAAALSAAESARLAAVLPSPRRWSARNPGPYVQSRSAWILQQMGHRPRPSAAAEPAVRAQPQLDPDTDDTAPAAPAAATRNDAAGIDTQPFTDADAPIAAPLDADAAPLPVPDASTDAPPDAAAPDDAH